MSPDSDQRRSSPAALRNRDPILDVLRRVMPATGTVLEIASGSGEHVVYFGQRLPRLTWQPSDPSAQARASIAAWLAAAGTPNIAAPIAIDAAQSPWPIARADAIMAINLLHISPWSATIGLMANAGLTLAREGILYLYGPFRRAGHDFAASNDAFDADLRARDAAWGVRDLADVVIAAEVRGLALDGVIAMPANNLSVVFRRV